MKRHLVLSPALFFRPRPKRDRAPPKRSRDLPTVMEEARFSGVEDVPDTDRRDSTIDSLLDAVLARGSEHNRRDSRRKMFRRWT